MNIEDLNSDMADEAVKQLLDDGDLFVAGRLSDSKGLASLGQQIAGDLPLPKNQQMYQASIWTAMNVGIVLGILIANQEGQKVQ